ncbi:protein MEI2-like 1 isoform X2 [Quercus lobata]|uniref:RRM domain-containing protein n=1 Tax=Quercus lobata TaxID=97700 RepID=A0A7N2RBA2_QUELO|nr:protein MEI2-like 1 isoform X2 [Quercus lobata]
MPFEVTDQRGVPASTHFFEDISFSSQREVGYQKPKSIPYHQGMNGMIATPGSLLDASLHAGKLSPIGTQSVDCLELPQTSLHRDQAEKLRVSGNEGIVSLSNASWKSMHHHMGLRPNVCVQLPSHSLEGKTTVMSGTNRESSLFSSSLSEIFSRKLGLLGNEVPYHLPASAVASYHDEEPFESLKEIEAQTIGNLLPDDDDLFSGMTDGLACNAYAKNGDDFEDYDLFSSGGGLELEGDDRTCMGQRSSDYIRGLSNGQVGPNGSIVGEHPYGEQPSRTLFVRNINSNVEDSELKALFEQFGDTRKLYTSCKHRGFVMISYYDIRAAQEAKKVLQNKALKRRKLDIHYSIPKDNPSERDVNQGTLVVFNLDSSVSDDEIRKIFGFYGEIKEILDAPHKYQYKLIEFYDVRAAEAALRALNRSEISGKQIKIEPSHSEIARWCLMQQPEQEQDGLNVCQSPCDNLSSGHTATVSPGVIASNSVDNGSNLGLHSAHRSSLSSFIENAFPHMSSSVPNNLPSPVGVASIGKQFGVCESNHSLNEMKFANQCIPNLHPHSFPEYHESLANSVPCNSLSTNADMAGNLGPRMTEGINSRQIHRMSSNVHPVELNGGVFGSSGNGSCPLHGHHYAWKNSNSYQQHPSSPVIWGNSPSFVDGVPAHRLPQMPGFPGGSPQLLNMSPVHHHVGSAPAVNTSLWDRRHTYLGESPEASSFHLGSLGSMGFPRSSQLHHIDISPHSTFSHIGGNCADMLTNAGQHSPQQMCNIFLGRNPMISMPASFDSASERVRNLSHRRNDVNSNLADKKQYELDTDRILRGEDVRTTLMIKNIPNKYTSKMLLAAIDEHCRGTYDFLYLPIDFKNKCNVGYAFINMIDARQIISFHQAFDGKKWEKFNSEKVASLAYARIQGKAALIAHFQNSSLMNEDKRCRPILFHTEGPNAGDPEPFPMGTNIRSRPGRSRTSSNEENHNLGNPSISANREEYSNGSDSSKDSD